MFLSCDQPIISYSGTYFKNAADELEYKCFEPNTWRTLEGTPGKLKLMMNLCQSAPHNCIKNHADPLYTDAQIPAVADLIPQTTTPTYHWFEQFKATTNVEGLTRCADRVAQAAVSTAPASSCESDLPNIFAKLPGQPPAKMRDYSDSHNSCPPGYASDSAECLEFLGFNNITLPAVESQYSYVERRALALAANVTDEDADIQPECIPQAVKISGECVV